MRRHTRASCERTRKVFPLICLLVGLSLFFFCSSQVFADEQGDNFDDPIKNTDKWGKDEFKNGGRLNETRGRLEYVVGQASATDSMDRPWILRQFPTTADWWIQIDATNNTDPSNGQWSSFGINVRHILGATNKESGNEIEVELAAFPNSSTREFYGEMHSNGLYWDALMGTPGISAPIRIAFNAAAKVFTLSGFTDVGGGPQWYDFGTFGVGPSGGGYYPDWGLTSTDKFVAYVFGYSNKMTVNDGKMYGDNFKEDGGVPWVGPFIGPTGKFRFAFPANSPWLAIIASITGHYSGLYPPSSWAGLLEALGIRPYEMDIAQDESGKLSYMGTMEGVTSRDNNSQLSGPLGAISTVNGKPTAKLKGSFNHNVDGKPGKSAGTAKVPMEVINIGGIDSVAGTTSYSGKIKGVPFSDKNVPFQVDAPLGTVENLKKNWTLQLDITSKQNSKGKSYLVASAELLLPNGDTIVFPEKKTTYSAKKGYSLSFSRGTNVTVEPDRLDKKTSISIKRMTMTQQQDGTWQPTGGTITYKFLGQQGSGNLVDFIPPSP